MYKVLPGYYNPTEFAEICPRKDGTGTGVTRQQVYYWINQEKNKPGSTSIDVLEVGGRVFVRLQAKPPRK